MIPRDAGYCSNFSFDSSRCYPAKNTWGDCKNCDMYECSVNPCPKCGSANVRNFCQYEPTDIERFECLDCGAKTMDYFTFPAALKAWNDEELEDECQ